VAQASACWQFKFSADQNSAQLKPVPPKIASHRDATRLIRTGLFRSSAEARQRADIGKLSSDFTDAITVSISPSATSQIRRTAEFIGRLGLAHGLEGLAFCEFRPPGIHFAILHVI